MYFICRGMACIIIPKSIPTMNAIISTPTMIHVTVMVSNRSDSVIAKLLTNTKNVIIHSNIPTTEGWKRLSCRILSLS